MGKQTGPERRNVILGERMRKGTVIIFSQTNRWDGNAIFSVEPIGTRTQLIYPLKPERERQLLSIVSQGTGTQVISFEGTRETGTKYIVSLRNVRDGNGKSKAAPGTKGVGTGNGSQFANRK